jgi:hypothetical protein
MIDEEKRMKLVVLDLVNKFLIQKFMKKMLAVGICSIYQEPMMTMYVFEFITLFDFVVFFPM